MTAWCSANATTQNPTCAGEPGRENRSLFAFYSQLGGRRLYSFTINEAKTIICLPKLLTKLTIGLQAHVLWHHHFSVQLEVVVVMTRSIS